MAGRTFFQTSMLELKNEIQSMCDMVVNAHKESIKVLNTNSFEIAKQVMADDALINKKRWSIESKCTNIIATQQPVASDLRKLIAVISIITDLERIGDYAKGNAKLASMIKVASSAEIMQEMDKMSQIAIDMIQRGVQAFLACDLSSVKEIIKCDEEVDFLSDKIVADLLILMRSDLQAIPTATLLIWAAHNLERTGDRVMNICERVEFLATGSLQEEDRTDRQHLWNK